MPDRNPSFMSRIALAIRTFFKTLSDAQFASRVERLLQGADTTHTQAAEAGQTPVRPLKAAAPDAALQLLGMLQREARFVDFIQEDVTAYSDADIGAAARLVHDGCRKVLREHFTLQPVREEAEGSRIVLNAGFDAAAIRLTGNVVGAPPFRGSVSHRGWRVTEVRLPKVAERHDASVIAPAEVEL
ncbi:MAG TPA: DUF2760 domain-containing protein [Burkholderiaceae bacterium]|nr:DUF2760 domain-containing protein [Burkholderiaceae bacterium]